MLISVFVLVVWEVCSLTSVSSLDFQRVCWLSIIYLTGLLCWCVHEGMLDGIGSWGKLRSMEEDISSMDTREGKLPLVLCCSPRFNLENQI